MGLPEVILISEDEPDWEPLAMGYPGQPLHWGPYAFPTAEHLFQSLKCTRPGDVKLLLSRPTAAEARSQGQRFVHMRQDWRYVQEAALRLVLAIKFYPGRPEVARLLETGDALLVHASFERWRGVDVLAALPGTDDEMESAWPRATGLNWLGTLLMARRAELVAQVGADVLDHQRAALWDYVRWQPPKS
jgi:predicted NAD-dependent protein-ADP-ribosyltransferase YbiA (DUF1768 family)